MLVHRNSSAFCSRGSIFPHSLKAKKITQNHAPQLCEHATSTQNHAKTTRSKIHKFHVFFVDIHHPQRKHRPRTRSMPKCTVNTRFSQNGCCKITSTSECSLHLHQSGCFHCESTKNHACMWSWLQPTNRSNHWEMCYRTFFITQHQACLQLNRQHSFCVEANMT